MSETQPFLTALAMERAYKSETEWDKEALATAEGALLQPTKILDDQPADRDYLLGDGFTVADLNVASEIYPDS